MNPRFKELIVQSINEVGAADADRGAKEATLQRFAELIVKECAWIASDYNGAEYVGDEIKQHFGVE